MQPSLGICVYGEGDRSCRAAWKMCPEDGRKRDKLCDLPRPNATTDPTRPHLMLSRSPRRENATPCMSPVSLATRTGTCYIIFLVSKQPGTDAAKENTDRANSPLTEAGRSAVPAPATPPTAVSPAPSVKPSLQDPAKQMVSGEGADGAAGDTGRVAAAAAEGMRGKSDGARTDADIAGKKSTQVLLEEETMSDKVR